jgi:hypothetical protein
MKKSIVTVFLIVLSNYPAFAQQLPPKPVSREGRPAQKRFFFPFKPKRNKEQEQMLLPNPADSIKYKNFLKQPDTGLVRLYPDIECESAYILRADAECAGKIPGSSYYSFRKKEYTSDFLADIRFKSRFFFADGVLTQSFFVNLGNVPLENVSLDSDGMKFLVDFKPEPENKAALKQYEQLSNGLRVGKYEYRKVAVAAENTTYALRSIAYKANIFTNYRGWIYNVLDGDKRIDITVVFRVVRRDKDGSMTLLWKELDRKKSVKMKISKSGDKKQQ